MRRVTYKSVLHGVATRLGMDPTTLQTNTAASLAEYLTEALRHAWEMPIWPELNPTEERTPVDNVVSLDQSGQTPIGEVLAVYATDPEANEYAEELNFTLKTGGIYIRNAPATVWVWFSLRPSQFSAVSYSDTQQYAVGDVVYFATTGECYKARAVTIGNTPINTTYWERQSLPYVLAEAVKHAALASALREDGQYDKAAVEDRIATEILDSEQDKIQTKQRQVRRFGVLSR